MTIFFLLALVALTVAALMWWAIREPGSRLLAYALIALMVVPLPAAAGAIDTFIAAASPGIIDLIGLALTGIIGWAAAAARKALGLFAQYRIMLRPYGMKNLFDEIYRMGTTDDEHRLYHLRRCCEDVLDDFGARSTLNGYRYAERMLLYALYAERPQKIGDL